MVHKEVNTKKVKKSMESDEPFIIKPEDCFLIFSDELFDFTN